MTRPTHVDVALDAIWAGAVAANHEGARLDFKQDARGVKDSFRIALDASLCLANAAGGSVVFGVVDDRLGPAAFSGSELDPGELRKYVHDNSRPHLLVEVLAHEYRGCRLVVIVVEADQELYCDPRGRMPFRIGSDCVGLDAANAMRLREERRGFDPSSVPARAADVDPAALRRARARLEASLRPERSILAKLSDLDLLRALGVTNSEGQLLDAGHRLIGADGTSVVYTYRESPGGEPRMVERLHGPLLTIYDRLTELISLRRRLTPVTLPDGQQLQVEDFPGLAVREAIGNALIHRDYRLTDPVVIDHSPSVLVVTSPGPLVAGVTLENIITHPSKPRNRLLAGAVRTLELAEEVGRGVDRMYREMIRSGRPTPAIEASFQQVRVALVGGAPDVNIARYVASLDTDVREDTDALIVLLKLCGTRTVTAQKMSPLLQKSVPEAEASLRHLASEQVAMIEPSRQTIRAAHPTYRLREFALRELGSAVSYVRNTLAELDQRVIAHVHEYGRITNPTVRNLFNVGMPRAQQILADLVEREILVKTSKAQRGPSVDYGPGTRFPQDPGRRRLGPGRRE
jgi:ATP-dependent DNA helicase RecG